MDVGANIGFWSLRFAHAFPQANVLAIEANPNTFQVLRENCIMVPVRPLASILVDADMRNIDVMKIDIEGFEGKVLTRFFSEAPRNLWPRYICAEITHVPLLASLLHTIGYRLLLVTRENSVFALDQS